MPYAGTTVHTIPPDRRLRRRGTIGRTTTQHARSTLVHVSLHARAGVAHSTVPHFPVHRSPRLRHPGLRTSRSRPGGRPGLTCYMFTFMYRTVVPHLTSYDLSCCVVRNPAKSVERKLLSLLPRARAWRAPRPAPWMRVRRCACGPAVWYVLYLWRACAAAFRFADDVLSVPYISM